MLGNGPQRSGPAPQRWGVGPQDGSGPELKGWLARPFGIFRGDAAGPGYHGCHTYTLAYVPTGRIVATFRTARQCKSLASDLARLWVRWGRGEPAEDPARLLQRFKREEA